MISTEIYNSIQRLIQSFETKDVDLASLETLKIYQLLGELKFDPDNGNDRMQVIAMLNHIQDVSNFNKEISEYVVNAREYADTNPEYIDTLGEGAEAGLSADHSHYNELIRTNLNEIIQFLTTNVAYEIGVHLDKDSLPEPSDVARAILNNQSDFRYKDTKKFSYLGDFTQADSLALFSHATAKVQKIPQPDEASREKHAAVWFRKLCTEKKLAGREVVAQEFYRLLMPYQPKTRVARDEAFNLYVLSKGATNATCLQDYDLDFLRDQLMAGKLKDYGKVLMTNLFFEEIDAKSGNMYWDKATGNVIKIDGDWCLASLRDAGLFAGKTNITAADIDRLPIVADYQPYNWMGEFQHGTVKLSRFFQREVAQHPGFRQEVNEALLNILMMPKELLETFVKSYIHDPAEVKLITAKMNDRYTQTHVAALANPSFVNYLQSAEAEQYMAQCITRMSEFTTQGKNHLIKNPDELRVQCQNILQGLRNEIAPVNQAMPVKVSSSAGILTQLHTAEQAAPAPVAAAPVHVRIIDKDNESKTKQKQTIQKNKDEEKTNDAQNDAQKDEPIIITRPRR